MTGSMLDDGDIGHDASDCKTAFDQGRVTVRNEEGLQRLTAARRIARGDEESALAHDERCDDMRFTGTGVTAARLKAEDVQHDATDRRQAYERGSVELL